MPFTLTHIAAVVPIKKLAGTLPFTALAIGSMVPDMPIFFDVFSQYSLNYSVTHSLAGIVTACLPIGLLLYAVFQVLIRTPLLEIMPGAVSSRLGGRTHHDAKYMLNVVVAVTLGACTHVLWDSFTHGGNWGVQQIPVLKETFILFNRQHRYYTLLQHGSSVVLLPLMAYFLYRWSTAPFVTPAAPYRSRLDLPLWIKLAGCFAIFVVPALWAFVEAWLHTRSFYYGIGLAARAYGRYMILTAIAFALLLQAAIWWKQSKLPNNT